MVCAISNFRMALRILLSLVLLACSHSSAQDVIPHKKIPSLSPDTCRSGGYTLATLIETDGDFGLHTTFVDWIDDDVFVLSLNNDLDPKSCVAFGHVFDFSKPEAAPVPVAFMFNRQGVLVGHKYWGRKGRPEEVTDYNLPLPKLIEGIAKSDLQMDHSIMQEAIISESDGDFAGGFLVSYRMPAESKFFGHPILACLAFPPRGPRQWYTNVNGAGVKYGRVRHPDKEFDPAQENAKGVTKETCRQLFLDNQFIPRSSIYSDSVYRMVKSSSEKSAKTLSVFDARERENVLYKLMLLIREDFDLILNDGVSLFFDPHVRGMMLEQALWRPERNPATVNFLLALVMMDLESSSGELSLSYSLHCAYANLGFAPNETSYAVMLNSPEGRAFKAHVSAAFRARWRFPTEQRHVDATVEFIQNAKHITDKLNCVETLILMDKFEHIPPDLMQRWFSEFTGNANQILRTLNLLMQNQTGRRYLAEKYKAMPADDPLREPIKALFKNELSAVHKSGDYRFFTKEECKQLDSDLQLELAVAGDESTQLPN